MGQAVVTVATQTARDALVVHDGLTIWNTADKKLQIYSTALGWLTIFEDTGWLKIGTTTGATAFVGSTLAAGVTHYASAGVDGLWARRRNGIVYFAGGFTGTVAANAPIFTLPVGWRPAATPGTILRLMADGTNGTVTRTSYTIGDDGRVCPTGAQSGNNVLAMTSFPVN